MALHALSAIGRDRPGIVAAVTGLLLEHGVNVEDRYQISDIRAPVLRRQAFRQRQCLFVQLCRGQAVAFLVLGD